MISQSYQPFSSLTVTPRRVQQVRRGWFERVRSVSNGHYTFAHSMDLGVSHSPSRESLSIISTLARNRRSCRPFHFYIAQRLAGRVPARASCALAKENSLFLSHTCRRTRILVVRDIAPTVMPATQAKHLHHSIGTIPCPWTWVLTCWETW